MGLLETFIFYAAIGAAVAVAVFVTGRPASPARQAFQTATAALFWPLYLPLLLARPAAKERREDAPAAQGPEDSLAAAIRQVESELASALSSLDGWAEDVLARERGRIEELVRTLRAQAARIREMDRLLLDEEVERDPAPDLLESSERARRSAASRQRNLEKLREVRRSAHDDLTGTLAWVRELVSMIQLAKFTGAPASRAEELVAQIAASVEGLSAVSGWR